VQITKAIDLALMYEARLDVKLGSGGIEPYEKARSND
jgi:hypothetical protein